MKESENNSLLIDFHSFFFPVEDLVFIVQMTITQVKHISFMSKLPLSVLVRRTFDLRES